MSEKVAKSNQLIQGRMGWSSLQQRIVAMLVSQLDREDERFEMQRVHVKDLLEKTGASGKSTYERMEEVCSELLDSKIEVRDRTEDGRRRYRGVNPFGSCEYVEGEGYVKARFTEDMRPFLLQLRRRFTTYQLENMIQLRSQYAMRIYELLKMREDLRHVSWPVEELREVLSCEDKYPRFSDFKKRVLEPAREQIKETCDIWFAYQVRRSGQKPTHVAFSIRRKGAQEGPIEHADPIEGAERPSVTAGEGTGDLHLEAMVREKLSQEDLSRITNADIHEALQRGWSVVDEALPEEKQARFAAREAAKILRD